MSGGQERPTQIVLGRPRVDVLQGLLYGLLSHERPSTVARPEHEGPRRTPLVQVRPVVAARRTRRVDLSLLHPTGPAFPAALTAIPQQPVPFPFCSPRPGGAVPRGLPVVAARSARPSLLPPPGLSRLLSPTRARGYPSPPAARALTPGFVALLHASSLRA